MSVSPAGGYYTAPPNRPPASNSSGCFKAAGITCSVLFLILLIGGIVLVRWGKQQFSSPSKTNFFGFGVEVGRATVDGIHLSQGVARYHQKNGRYPKLLTDLVLDGEIDGKILHNDLDANSSPGHISWRYVRPAEGASGKTPILKLPYTVNFVPNKPAQTGDITITLDGKTMTGTSASTPANGQLNRWKLIPP